jgi:predicted small metal-binding protein
MAKYTFKCADIGMNCGFQTKASTKEELMPLIAEHAKTAHGMNEIPPDVMEKVNKAIKKSFF